MIFKFKYTNQKINEIEIIFLIFRTINVILFMQLIIIVKYA